MTIDLANAFFSITVSKNNEKQFAMKWQKQQYILIVLLEVYVYIVII